MGLVLYAILVLFGARGMHVRRAVIYLFVTAVLLTILGLGGLESLPSCSGFGCRSAASAAMVFITALAVGAVCFGAGAAARKLFTRRDSD